VCSRAQPVHESVMPLVIFAISVQSAETVSVSENILRKWFATFYFFMFIYLNIGLQC